MSKAHTQNDLEHYQALPLNVKILMTKNRIRKWVNEYGTQDAKIRMTLSPESLVLAHIVNESYPTIRITFADDQDAKLITAWMASEDKDGIDDWLTYGCNHYDTERPESRPMSFWTREDVFEYIEVYT